MTMKSGHCSFAGCTLVCAKSRRAPRNFFAEPAHTAEPDPPLMRTYAVCVLWAVALAACADDDPLRGDAAGGAPAQARAGSAAPSHAGAGGRSGIDAVSGGRGGRGGAGARAGSGGEGGDIAEESQNPGSVPSVCGNGQIEPGEQCDDGNQDDTDSCLSTCKVARCGDGLVQAGVEACDDANDDEDDD
jgi:cysteine-rich repeat protein